MQCSNGSVTDTKRSALCRRSSNRRVVSLESKRLRTGPGSRHPTPQDPHRSPPSAARCRAIPDSARDCARACARPPHNMLPKARPRLSQMLGLEELMSSSFTSRRAVLKQNHLCHKAHLLAATGGNSQWVRGHHSLAILSCCPQEPVHSKVSTLQSERLSFARRTSLLFQRLVRGLVCTSAKGNVFPDFMPRLQLSMFDTSWCFTAQRLLCNASPLLKLNFSSLMLCNMSCQSLMPLTDCTTRRPSGVCRRSVHFTNPNRHVPIESARTVKKT